MKKHSHPISQKIIKFLTENNQIILRWIPSHTNNNGNEIADCFAKKAHQHFPMDNIPIPLSNFKLHTKNLMLKGFQTYWAQIPQPNKLENNKNTIDIRNSSNKNSRRSEIILTIIQTGHSLFTHQHLSLKQHPPICLKCNSPITILHILIKCPLYKTARAIYLHNNNELKILLSDNQKNVENLLQHLKSINLSTLI